MFTCTRACTTKYLGPTDYKGSRVKATHCNTGRSAILPWNDALGSSENHEAVARKVLGDLDSNEPYRGKLIGCSANDGGYVFMAVQS